MIFLPLTVAATVVSGVVVDDEQATTKTAMTLTSRDRTRGVEILFTSLLLKVDRAAQPVLLIKGTG
jgi:hypothetical protein